MAEEIVKLYIGIPKPLHAKIKKAAAADDRKITDWCVKQLRKAVTEAPVAPDTAN
jgi:hypothetical protein